MNNSFKFTSELSLPELIHIVESQKIYQISHRGEKFQKQFFQENQRTISRNQYSNLKRKLMKKMLKDCSIALNSKEQGNISERTFLDSLQKKKQLEGLCQKLQKQHGYIALLISTEKDLSLIERVLGICFLYSMKIKLSTCLYVPNILNNLIQKRQKRKEKDGIQKQSLDEIEQIIASDLIISYLIESDQ